MSFLQMKLVESECLMEQSLSELKLSADVIITCLCDKYTWFIYLIFFERSLLLFLRQLSLI